MTTPVIIFIHGFGSNGYGSKAQAMREYCQQHSIPYSAPSLSHIPDLALQTLRELIEQLQRVSGERSLCLMGSSLGGFYAQVLALEYELPVVLINPSMHAGRSLRRALGTAINYYDDSPYQWRESYVDMLDKLEPSYPLSFSKEQCWLLAQTADELLDYREAVQALPQAKHTIEPGGDHGFQGFASHIPEIVSFFRYAITST
ncbi:alpha/beta fold hydrolase [Pseudidiomarina sp. 1ASP75-14]|uniref:YqiA/YcfP family alpha/beta fold hydrolase n=1 Tax=Pseudidiomarina terrestris TaxID=2820060 RepID=UPI00264ED05D|nr:YqiA/YcfP family alpha/beta fold hydrolase [Pseudidiomarina sp. 1ASP75-14]MDN7138741.1 alpha/beta fold hydrolase [Pseudidiomarina sp. 1ASP75-14]